ncbi:Por secretion system C-terminal sorting domain-containing protein [Flavobacterium johnsoniae]|uniref:Por secretion system C-terminal sorting domain-containing protein n=2 Tax=Flavobacterium johnsoniae TaxID=986 RepID=A0A1M5H977_FLAJO|nr:Por secretion system C-terminal sorting domain-containing protein [Flavobacterium johnsoniae]
MPQNINQPMKTKLLLLLVLANFSIYAQYTLIPDSNFENKLISLGIDKDGKNGKVETSSIESVTSLDISYSDIKNIAGIEDFKSLTTLICNDNEIYVLNITENKALKYLDCSSTMVYILDFSNNPELTHIKVSKNPYVTKIDVSNNLNLVSLDCNTTSISRLDVSKNTKLTTLNCSQNYIMDLDLSYNTALTSLDCSKNSYTLTTLNLKNGNNHNFTLAGSNFTENPYLTCITVDSQNYSNDNWSSLKDNVAAYNTSCLDGPYTLIPDPNFEKALIKAGIDYRELDGKVLTANILLITGVNLSGNNINDLTGIEGFLNLQTLNCKTNNLTSLDLSKNIDLTSVNCSENKLINLDLTNKPNFISLNSSSNPNLTCIKVDDPGYSLANWNTVKDVAANYSTSCNLGIQNSVFSYAVLSPNPTKGEITITNVSLEKANVYNALGQLVKSFTLNLNNTDNTINLSGLPKGVYYVYLINQDAASAKKVIVE